MERRIRTAVLGATGAVGQRFLSLLDRHPWFQVCSLHASRRRVGGSFAERARWLLDEPLHSEVADLPLRRIDEIPGDVDLVFSALPSEVAGPVETAWADAGIPVVSNAAAHRLSDQVPLLVPEVNPEALHLARSQAEQRGGGFIATNPNCSTAILVLALAPLQRAFGVEQVVVATYQAASGAGYPGVPSVDLLGNVIPHISGEEAKMVAEPAKILSTDLVLSAHCMRVPVLDGHLMGLSLHLGRSDLEPDQILEALRGFRAPPHVAELPSAPDRPIHVLPEPDRPQPRLDALRGGGMSVSVGRLRPCPVLGWRLTVLGHNTLRGGAGGAVLIAELLVREGLVTPQV